MLRAKRTTWRVGVAKKAPTPTFATLGSTLPALRGGGIKTSRLDLHVLKVAGLVVDADLGWRDPGCEFACVRHRRHQRRDEVAIFDRGQPRALFRIPCRIVDHDAFGRGV